MNVSQNYFQQYFSYIMTVSFTYEGDQRSKKTISHLEALLGLQSFVLFCSSSSCMDDDTFYVFTCI